MRVVVVILAIIFALGCTRFVVEFTATPTENGGQEITVGKVTSWGAFGLTRNDSFIIEQTEDKYGKSTIYVERNTEENAREQIQMLELIIALAQTATLAQQAPAPLIE